MHPRRGPAPIGLAFVLAFTALFVASPTRVSASCHVGGYTETQKTGWAPGTEVGNRTSATTRVRWRYHYDCSWDIIAVEIDWRRITIVVDGTDSYLGGYGRDLVSFHALARDINPDTAYPAYSPCYQAKCSFGPWTDNGNVYIPYSPGPWSKRFSPHTRAYCDRCYPTGIPALVQDYWFVHGQQYTGTPVNYID